MNLGLLTRAQACVAPDTNLMSWCFRRFISIDPYAAIERSRYNSILNHSYIEIIDNSYYTYRAYT